jgi:biotin carboxyl carrier protein
VLADEGVSAAVIDVATLKPLDMETILESVAQSGRCVIVHEAPRTAGLGAEIAANLADAGLYSLSARCSAPATTRGAAGAAGTQLHAVGGADRRRGATRAGSSLAKETAMRIFNCPTWAKACRKRKSSTGMKPGDTIAADQPLLSVETAKAIVEIPSPFAGQVAKLFAQPGDIVHLGAPLVGFEGAGAPDDAGTVVGAVKVGTHVVNEGVTRRRRRHSRRTRHQGHAGARAGAQAVGRPVDGHPIRP